MTFLKKHTLAFLTLIIFSTTLSAQYFNNYSYLDCYLILNNRNNREWLNNGNLGLIVNGTSGEITHYLGAGTTPITGVNYAQTFHSYFVILDSAQQFVKAQVWISEPNTNNTEHFGIGNLYKDPDGNFLLTGMQVGRVDIDPGVDTLMIGNNGTAGTGILIKLDPEGELLWYKSFKPTDSTSGLAALSGAFVDDLGNIVIGGIFQGEIDFNPGPGTALLSAPIGYHEDHGVIVKLDSLGNFISAVRLERGRIENMRKGIAGNIIVSGVFNDSINVTVNSNPDEWYYTNAFSGTPFIVSYDEDFNTVWSRSLEGYSWNLNIESDVDGNVYSACTVLNNAVLGDGSTIQTKGPGDMAVEKWSPNGSQLWKSIYASTGGDGIEDILLANDLVYVSVSYYDSLITHTAFPDTLMVDPQSNRNVCISRLDPLTGGFLDGYAINDNAMVNRGTALAVKGNRVDFNLGLQSQTDLDPGNNIYNSIPFASLDINIVLVSWMLDPITFIPTEISNPLLANPIRVFPNPATHQLYLDLSEGVNVQQVQILDISGKTLRDISEVNAMQGIDVSGLPAGLYFIRMNDGKSWTTRKFMKN